MSEKKALFIKKVNGWRGDARLYRLSEKVKFYNGGSNNHETSHVIVSAVDLECFGLLPHDCETYIFPATEDGEAICMMDMEGSLKGTKDHAEALRGLGFEEEVIHA